MSRIGRGSPVLQGSLERPYGRPPLIADPFSIDTGQQLAGRLGKTQTKRVQDWIAARREALEENWQRALRGQTLEWIDPL